MNENKKLPKDWKWVKLGDVCKLKNGYAFKSSEYIEIGIPVIRISDIKDGLIVPRNTVRVKEDENFDSYIINENEIIVAMSGATTGKFGIYKSKEKAYQNQRVGKFDIINTKLLNNNFLLHQLHSLKRQIEKDAYGGAQPNISSKKIEEMEFVLPPLPIQEAIVAKIEELFSELDKGIENLKNAQAQLKIYKKAIILDGVTGKLTKKWRENNKSAPVAKNIFNNIQLHLDNYYSKSLKTANADGKRKPRDQRKNKKINNNDIVLPSIPSNWEYYRLEDLTIMITDGTHYTPRYQDDGVIFLSVKNVRPFYLKIENVKYISYEEHKKLIERCNPEKDDILYTKIGATFGYACSINIDFEFSIFVSLCLIKPIHEFYSSKFLEILMNSELVFNQARKRVSGSGVPDLHLIEIRDFKIPLMSLVEQQKIVKEIESRLSLADKLEESISQSLQQAESLRQSILKKAFEGKLV